MINSLAQTLAKITAPGVPDLYQGTELWSLHLVDPDNRGDVDYGSRQRLLQAIIERCRSLKADRRSLARELTAQKEDGRIKLYLTWQALQCRKENPGLFSTGEYLPVETRGPGANHAFAFMRRQGSVEALVVVPRLLATLRIRRSGAMGRFVVARDRIDSSCVWCTTAPAQCVYRRDRQRARARRKGEARRCASIGVVSRGTFSRRVLNARAGFGSRAYSSRSARCTRHLAERDEYAAEAYTVILVKERPT